MWHLAAALLFQGSLSVQLVNVFVRTVDRDGFPLPGISVSVSTVNNCTDRRAAHDADSVEAVTRADGEVRIPLERGRTYLLKTDDRGGMESVVRCIRLGDRADDRFVQIQLRADPRNMVTIVEPSVGPPEPPARDFVVGDFEGIYEADGRVFWVLTDGDKGIQVEGPGGDVTDYPERVGTVFRGASGTVAFAVSGRRVTGLTITTAPIKAKRLPARR